ncbi:unnamed protein product [Ophioblennius macclurei]
MLLIFLLQLIHRFESLSGAEHETLCTSNACFTAHMERVSFERAQQSCRDNGGYLMTQRDRQEEDALLSLLSLIQRQRQDRTLKFWIGLKLHRQNCVLPQQALRGFKWVSGEENSYYSNWKKDPIPTCREERCVRVEFSSSDQSDLKWTAGPCKNPSFYACKFYFQGMCRPLALLGPGRIMYTAPFSQKPEKSELKSFPLGTYANIECDDQQLHFSLCRGDGDIYSWLEPGPFCKSGKQSCEINNGGCEHVCHQEADDVKCSCKEEHDLEADGLTCRMKNLCGPDTCQHECVMSVSGFFCKCPEGFVLSENQRNCTDVNECQSNPCEDHLCINTHGGYRCACNDGYHLVNGKCSDVDECEQSKCEHRCENKIGSFSCHCREGFVLSEDGFSCVDVNECSTSSCFAEFVCINTMGSFTCTIPQDELNASTPVPHVIVTSTAPSDEPADEQTQENFTESLSGNTVELQHQSPHTDSPLSELVNATQGDQQGNSSLSTGPSQTVNARVLICVLGSVIPLLLLVAVTLFIAIFRCSRAKKEAKKTTTTDGYCWVSSGLDPRLEKLYESILTDDL